MQEFAKLLLKMFQEKRTDNLTLKDVREHANSQISSPFSEEEIQAALHKMSDENKIMVADDNIILI